jgi:hypothetical protein
MPGDDGRRPGVATPPTVDPYYQMRNHQQMQQQQQQQQQQDHSGLNALASALQVVTEEREREEKAAKAAQEASAASTEAMDTDAARQKQTSPPNVPVAPEPASKRAATPPSATSAIPAERPVTPPSEAPVADAIVSIAIPAKRTLDETDYDTPEGQNGAPESKKVKAEA